MNPFTEELRARAEFFKAEANLHAAEGRPPRYIEFYKKSAEHLRQAAFYLDSAPHDESECDVPSAIMEGLVVDCTCWKKNLLEPTVEGWNPWPGREEPRDPA